MANVAAGMTAHFARETPGIQVSSDCQSRAGARFPVRNVALAEHFAVLGVDNEAGDCAARCAFAWIPAAACARRKRCVGCAVMGDGRLSVPLGVYDEDELLCRTTRSGETGSPARPPVSLGLTRTRRSPGVRHAGTDRGERSRRVGRGVSRGRQPGAARLQQASRESAARRGEQVLRGRRPAVVLRVRARNDQQADQCEPRAVPEIRTRCSSSTSISPRRSFARSTATVPSCGRGRSECALRCRERVADARRSRVCGAAMANVHIFLDLQTALREAGCITADDYGNMLVFVNRGNLAALVRLRGRAVGEAERMLQELVGPIIDLDGRRGATPRSRRRARRRYPSRRC